MSFRSRPIITAVLVAALAVGASACSDDDLSPEEARLERVEERLKLSFTDEQVGCMLDQFSDGLVVALDGEGKMPESGAELDEFTTITRECIVDSGDVPGAPEGTGPIDEPVDTPEPADTTEPSDTEPSDTEAGEDPDATDTTAAPDADGPGGPATRPEAGPPDNDGNGNGNGNGDDEQATPGVDG